ncbi:MAG: tRNA (adenosine(37)-N6)-threonylcarbamoyltransferase complex dimerization subunit type 1 TsaB [Bacteroidales bacterium]
MPRILLIETTGQSCSVALTGGEKIISLRENSEGMSHATLLTVFIEEIFREQGITGSQLDAVAVSMGPGSYTGIRIGVAAAKGICYATGKPLIAINSLQAMSWGIQEELVNSKNPLANDPGTLFCPMVDARRMEVYLSLLNQQHEFVSEIQALILHGELYANELREHQIVFFGSGSGKALSLIQSPAAHFVSGFLNRATHLLSPALKAYRESRFEDTAYFEPFYLKDFVATVPKKKV